METSQNRLQLQFIAEGSVVPDLGLRNLWNERISSDLSMAPSILIEKNLANLYTESHWNRIFGDAVSQYMKAVIGLLQVEMGQEEREHGEILHIGPGPGYDVGYFTDAIRNWLQVSYVDVADTAFRMIQHTLDDLVLAEIILRNDLPAIMEPNFYHADVEKFVSEFDLKRRNTLVVYAGRVFQHMQLANFQNTLRGLAGCLVMPGRRLVVAHLFANTEKEGRAYNRPNDFRTTFPHTEEDFLRPLEKAGGCKFEIPQAMRVLVPFYDNQMYTIFTIQRAGGASK